MLFSQRLNKDRLDTSRTKTAEENREATLAVLSSVASITVSAYNKLTSQNDEILFKPTTYDELNNQVITVDHIVAISLRNKLSQN